MSRGIPKQKAYKIMEGYAKRDKEIKLSPKATFYLILCFLFAFLGYVGATTWATKMLAGALAGMITSEAAGTLVKKMGGRKLEDWSLIWEIGPFKFSITAFAIVTSVVEIILFK